VFHPCIIYTYKYDMCKDGGLTRTGSPLWPFICAKICGSLRDASLSVRVLNKAQKRSRTHNRTVTGKNCNNRGAKDMIEIQFELVCACHTACNLFQDFFWHVVKMFVCVDTGKLSLKRTPKKVKRPQVQQRTCDVSTSYES
jgi:hypothetical protein